MKNTAAIPFFAVTAAAAFGLGWVARPSADTSSVDGNEKSVSSSRVFSGRTSGGQSDGLNMNTPEGRFLSNYLVNGEISAEDMEAAMRELGQINDPLLRQKLLAELIENLTPDNAKAAFLALRESQPRGMFGRGGNGELSLLANAWGRLDGEGAMAALKEIAAEEPDRDRGGRGGGRGPGGLGREMIGALSGWASVDDASAIAYLDTVEDGREQAMAGVGIVRGLLMNGVSGAMNFVESMAGGEDGGGRAQEMYMAMIAGEVLEQGDEAAKDWVNSVNDPELKSGALTRVAMELMEGDREGTGDWLASFGDDEAAVSAVSRFSDSWSREDPQAVLEWADQLNGAAKAEAYEEAIESWAREDSSAAGTFLSNLPASAERDSATGAYATRVSREDPVVAMEWAGSISDEQLRQEVTVEVAQDWYRIDRAAAEEWIATSNLSDEQVNEVTSTQRGDGGGGGFRGGGQRGGR